MQLHEIPIGEIFTIGETPSYPKWRTPKGWIDVRDHFVIKQANAPADCRVMTKEEFEAQHPGCTIEGVKTNLQNWFGETL